MCLLNGTTEAVAPLLLTPTGLPAGKGCLSPSEVARMTSRAWVLQGESGMRCCFSSSFQEARGEGYSEGPQLPRMAHGEAPGPRGGCRPI